MEKVTVIGSGAWGTALAQTLDDNGHDVIIYGTDKSQIDDININHRNSFYFGDKVTINETLSATLNLPEALKDTDIVLMAVPSKVIRDVLRQVCPLLTKPVIFINTSKGFDTEKNIRISEMIREVVPTDKLKAVVSLIGPSHAEEVIVRDLTCVDAVGLNEDANELIANLFSNKVFRVYTNNDEVGSEIGVAFKNAIAIGSGMLAGMGFGDNSKAALCTRGLAEMVRFGVSFGGRKETYLGLTGVGDLLVTCYSIHSRNFQAGFEIGKEDSAEYFIKRNTKTVEGIRTVKVVHELAKEKGIELPIISTLYEILFNNKKPSELVSLLMVRPLKKE